MNVRLSNLIQTQEGRYQSSYDFSGGHAFDRSERQRLCSSQITIGAFEDDSPSSVQLVQDKPKSDTIKKRVKRAWKDLTGYKFDVGCPIILPLTHRTCTETGKNREDARAKCVSANPFCFVTQASR